MSEGGGRWQSLLVCEGFSIEDLPSSIIQRHKRLSDSSQEGLNHRALVSEGRQRRNCNQNPSRKSRSHVEAPSDAAVGPHGQRRWIAEALRAQPAAALVGIWMEGCSLKTTWRHVLILQVDPLGSLRVVIWCNDRPGIRREKLQSPILFVSFVDWKTNPDGLKTISQWSFSRHDFGALSNLKISDVCGTCV